ncbi:MAG TPA: hypothetical protein VEL05_02600 [Candidatus Acidoferrum sp.]|nr:hypothetical protein [Candidatus Acidoferrum sp.]
MAVDGRLARAVQFVLPELEPEERVFARSQATLGPSPWGFLWLAVPLSIALNLARYSGATGLVAYGPWVNGLLYGIALAVWMLFVQRPGFVVLTDRRLLFVRASVLGRVPLRLVLAVPRADYRITDQGEGWTAAFVILRDRRGKRLRLNFPKRLWWGSEDTREVARLLRRPPGAPSTATS